jgi:hypothetical protein
MALFLALREEMRHRADHCLGGAADVVEGAGEGRGSHFYGLNNEYSDVDTGGGASAQ